MKKLYTLALMALASLALTGCGVGTIETGHVGVRTSFGQVQQDEVQPGFYVAITSHVDEYTTKETSIALTNLTPKAKDKLRLQDLDVTVYYTTAANKIADFASTHTGMSAHMKGEGFIRPGYFLIENLAAGIISDETAKFDSMTLHQNRTELENGIKTSLSAQLQASDPGYFKITRVVASSLITDPSVEDSIRKNIAMSNEIDTAMKNVKKMQQEAEAMTKTANALTPMLLQNEYIKAIALCAGNPKCTLIVGSSATPMLNLPK